MQCLSGKDFKTILHELPVFIKSGTFQDFFTSITLVVEQRMPGIPEMRPDLVSTACFELAFYQRHITKTLHHTIMGNGMLTLLPFRKNKHLQPVLRITGNMSGNGSLIFRHISPNQRHIFSVDGVIKKLFAQN